MEVVANKNCAGIIAGSLACERERGVLCTNPRPPPPSLHEKTLCDHQCFSAIAAAESKEAAARMDARLVCIPKLSDPACVPPEAAASVDSLPDMRDALHRAQYALALFYERTKESMHAAFDSNKASMPDERADAHLVQQGSALHVGGRPEAAASDDNLHAMRQAVAQVKDALKEVEKSLLAHMPNEQWHAAFDSYEMPDERAYIQLATQGRARHVGLPPGAAASVDNFLAMSHALSRVKVDLWLLELMTEEPMRAAFKSYEAPMPDECADAQLAPQGRAWHVGVPPEAAASDDNLLAMRDDAVSRVYIVLWELQELLLAQMIKEPMHAAFGSYDA